MAKIQHTELLDSYRVLSNTYDASVLWLDKAGTKTAMLVDDGSLFSITLKGKDLAYSSDSIVGGRVDKVIFTNDQGQDFAVVTEANFDAKKLFDSLDSGDGFSAFVDKIYGGDDIITGTAAKDMFFGGAGDDVLKGKAGNDIFFGGKGDDRFVGGAGSDSFEFLRHEGSDVIADFDANGGLYHQDAIFVEDMNFTIAKQGDDVVIDFGGGDTLTLLNVHRQDVTTADFFVMT